MPLLSIAKICILLENAKVRPHFLIFGRSTADPSYKTRHINNLFKEID